MKRKKNLWVVQKRKFFCVKLKINMETKKKPKTKPIKKKGEKFKLYLLKHKRFAECKIRTRVYLRFHLCIIIIIIPFRKFKKKKIIIIIIIVTFLNFYFFHSFDQDQRFKNLNSFTQVRTHARTFAGRTRFIKRFLIKCVIN